ncbi:malate synthase G [Devosia sp.]|uniref:malate synthase G n=1 Tax=Devosia sp. TaxID=1871048 RepID=UPI001B057F7C|nr:malate synthase G [Devosia sp.]MBO9591202.1 malate synthase G [Devosia sp.]
MSELVPRHGLNVAPEMATFIETEALPGTGVDVDAFWAGYAKTLNELAPVNRQLLQQRDSLQAAIDDWHERHRGRDVDALQYRKFLSEIGYLAPEGGEFAIETRNIDPEISLMAGPQLVVPVMNARFALNAANARWGSLYDALYGTDAIEGRGPDGGAEYDPERGAAVVAWAANFLDTALPLATGRHEEVCRYVIEGGSGSSGLTIELADGTLADLANPGQFLGHADVSETRRVLLFVHNGLHLEIHIDPHHPIGRNSPSGVCDIVMESALTTIQDCEDSIAAVDAGDKVKVYRNWLGLMKADLTETITKNGQTFTRRLAPDRHYTGVDGNTLTLPGRSLMLVRNVGHLMTTDAILDSKGQETPEGIMDAFVTALAAMHELRKTAGLRNSRSGSVYIVKPKMHGPEEVRFANTLFDRVEDVLGLARHTLKMGVMDEERRTSVNLGQCIAAAAQRLVFINTGFLDRTGDEIHTSMRAGPVVPKAEIKDAIWLTAYENNNVDLGLRHGLEGRAQIGKGMWARPDDMREMLATKMAHPRSGASTAWVPSPTAATLHATHYHQVDVAQVRESLRHRERAALDALLTPPLLGGRNLSSEAIQRELDNNCQSILGYVVRWIDQGIGCSKVPDVNDVALMEDRATLRISSQHIANWLLHGLVTEAQVVSTMQRMAVVVDMQNADDVSYHPMAPAPERSIAFQTALELVLEGGSQPNGYTEPILHKRRRQAKAAASPERATA